MKIEIYGTPSCGACRQAKEYCDKNNLEYDYYSVGTDITPEEFMEKCDSMSVPVIFVDGKKYIGFSPKFFEV